MWVFSGYGILATSFVSELVQKSGANKITAFLHTVGFTFLYGNVLIWVPMLPAVPLSALVSPMSTSSNIGLNLLAIVLSLIFIAYMLFSAVFALNNFILLLKDGAKLWLILLVLVFVLTVFYQPLAAVLSIFEPLVTAVQSHTGGAAMTSAQLARVLTGVVIFLMYSVPFVVHKEDD